jgi:uncharacterized membrane protein
MGVAGLVLGVLSAVGALIPFINYGTWLLGVVGIVLSALGMKKAKRDNESAGLAVAGLVLSIIGTVIGISACICTVLCAAGAASAADALNNIR